MLDVHLGMNNKKNVFYICVSNFMYIAETECFPSWQLFSASSFVPDDEIITIRQEKRGEKTFLHAKGYENFSTALLNPEDPYSTEQQVYRFCANILLSKGVLHLHCSFVLYKGKAILFTGPSGIGKTTQAELWRDYADGLIVNGDAALIRKVDGVWTAFGTPIHGSSPYCENRQAPIVALIRLDQGKENMLEPMNGYKALTTCLPEFYHPKLEPETEEVFWHTIDEFFSEIPVYHMTCRPDREAVELVKNEFFDK